MDIADILEFLWTLASAGYRRPWRSLRHVALLMLGGGLPLGLLWFAGWDGPAGLTIALWIWAAACAAAASVLSAGILIRIVWTGIATSAGIIAALFAGRA